MRHTLMGLALIASITANPVIAQNATPQISAEATADLECAIWASFVAGTPDIEPEVTAAMGYALSYWIGKFEGATERHFDDVATVEFVSALEGRIEQLSETCSVGMENMGLRLQQWGEKMVRAGEEGQL